MKKFITTLLLLSIVCCLYAQVGREKLKEKTFNSEKFKPYTVEIEKERFAADVFMSNLSTAVFLDGRADTSKFGFIRTGDYGLFHRFIFPEAASSYITQRLAKTVKFSDTSGRKKTVFVLHHLWLSQITVKAGLLKSLLLTPTEFICFCYINADCYSASAGDYHYIGSIDTVVSVKKWMGHAANDLLKKTLRIALTVADSLWQVTVTDNKIVPLKHFNETETKRYDYAILAGPPKKGIFFSYEEFLSNAPRDIPFEIIEKKGRKEIKCNTIDTTFTNSAWGYSDGITIFKHVNNSYYRMVKTENTFELVAPRVITKLYTNGEKIFHVAVAAFFRGIVGGFFAVIFMNSDDAIMHELVPYQLNIKEGTLY